MCLKHGLIDGCPWASHIGCFLTKKGAPSNDNSLQNLVTAHGFFYNIFTLNFLYLYNVLDQNKNITQVWPRN